MRGRLGERRGAEHREQAPVRRAPDLAQVRQGDPRAQQAAPRPAPSSRAARPAAPRRRPPVAQPRAVARGGQRRGARRRARCGRVSSWRSQPRASAMCGRQPARLPVVARWGPPRCAPAALRSRRRARAARRAAARSRRRARRGPRRPSEVRDGRVRLPVEQERREHEQQPRRAGALAGDPPVEHAGARAAPRRARPGGRRCRRPAWGSRTRRSAPPRTAARRCAARAARGDQRRRSTSTPASAG